MSPLRRAGQPFLRARRQPPSPLLARHAVHVCRAARCWHTSAGLCSSDKPRPEPDMDSAPAVFDASGWPPAVAPYAQLSRAEKPIGTSIQELFALRNTTYTRHRKHSSVLAWGVEHQPCSSSSISAGCVSARGICSWLPIDARRRVYDQ